MSNLEKIKTDLSSYPAVLVAVSKTQPESAILELYNTGQRIFGENRVQELTQKYENLPKDIRWHLIGTLQTNKVKYIAPFVEMIHSADSEKLIETIDKCAMQNNRKIKILLQIKIADEETKQGFTPEELSAYLASENRKKMTHVTFCGVMGMATQTDDFDKVRSEFKQLKTHFDTIKALYFKDEPDFKEISMGMSADYKIALEEGSTLVRIGSRLFVKCEM